VHSYVDFKKYAVVTNLILPACARTARLNTVGYSGVTPYLATV